MIKRLGLILSLLILTAAGAHARQSQPQQNPQSGDDLKGLRKEIEELRKGQDDIRKELLEIKNILMGKDPSAPDPRTISLVLNDPPLIGSKSARVAVIEFSDYQCPFCGKYAHETWPLIQKEYIQTGKIRYAFRNFPLTSIHPNAYRAAVAADCAGEQGKFWEMHDRLFANSTALADGDLEKYAQAVGVDGAKFKQCLDSGKDDEKIRGTVADGAKAGVGGTPTFFVGTIDAEDKFKVLQVVTGAQPYPNFKQLLDDIIANQK